MGAFREFIEREDLIIKEGVGTWLQQNLAKFAPQAKTMAWAAINAIAPEVGNNLLQMDMLDQAQQEQIMNAIRNGLQRLIPISQVAAQKWQDNGVMAAASDANRMKRRRGYKRYRPSAVQPA